MISFFRDSAKIIKAGKKQIISIAVLYALIFIIIFLTGKAFSSIFFQNKDIMNPIAAIPATITYFLVLTFFYSFFKLAILEIAEKKKIQKKSFVLLGSFFLFNIIIALLSFLAIVLLGSFITFSFRGSVNAGAVFLLVFSLFFYPFLLFSQFGFLKEKRTIKSIANAWKKTFSFRLGKYFIMLLANFIIVAVYSLFFYLIGNLYRVAFIENSPEPAFFIRIYNSAFSFILLIVVILLLSFNVLYLRKLRD